MRKASTQDSLPSPPNLFSVAWGRALTTAIQRALDRRTPDVEARKETLLLSPNGSVFAVSVKDDGSVVTELRSKLDG